MYHEHEEYLWTAEEIGSSQDTADCDTLTVNEQFSVKHVLAWAHFPGEPHSSRAHRIGKNLILLLSWILVAGSYRSNILKLGKFTKSVEQPSGLPMRSFCLRLRCFRFNILKFEKFTQAWNSLLDCR